MNWVGVARGLAGERKALVRVLRHGAAYSEKRVRVGLAAALLWLGACDLHNPGITPPPGKLAYPVALELSTQVNEQGAAKYLYVANANFDLHYNGGSVQAYDLDELASLLQDNKCVGHDPSAPPDVPDASMDADVPDADVDADVSDADVDAEVSDASLDGGAPDAAPDAEVPDAMSADAGPADAELPGAEAGEAQDGSTDAQAEPEAGAGDAALADAGAGDAGADAGAPEPIEPIEAGVSEGAFARSQRGVMCDGRVGPDGKRADPEDATRCCFGSQKVLDDVRTSEVRIDSFATGLALSPDGETLYVPVRSTNRLVYIASNAGDLSCGKDKGRCQRGAKLGEKPDGEEFGFGPDPTAVATGSFKQLGVDRDDDFVVTAHQQGDVSLFRIGDDGEPVLIDTNPLAVSQRAMSIYPDPKSEFLYVGAVAANSVERLAVRALDDGPPDLAIYAAPVLSLNGLTGTQDIRDVMIDSRPRPEGAPLRAYALMRGGSSAFTQEVAFVELPSETDDGRFARAVDAVRVGQGPSRLAQADIGGQHLLFASCYDAAEIHVIDVDRRETVAVIYDVLGPYDMQIDVPRQLMYVTDFLASVVRVVDLHSLFVDSSASPRVVATLGTPIRAGKVR